MKKKILKNKLIAVITIISLFICSFGVSATKPIDIDDFLLQAGFPEDIIDKMSDVQKDMVYENSKNEIIKFAGYESQDFVLENDNLSPVQPRGGLISSSDLTLSVFGIYSIDVYGTVLNSTVYPSFVWHTPVKVKNDSFSMAMYSGWEAIPGQENLNLHLMNSYGQSAQQVSLDPSNSHAAGYSYKIPSNIGFNQALYEGHAYYKIDKKTTNASPRISLHYVHDTSPSLNVSYSINIGFLSISLSVNNNYLYEMSGNFDVDRLA